MRKLRKRMISLLLCLLMVTGCIYELPLSASATPVTQPDIAEQTTIDNASISENDATLPTASDTDNTVSVSDKTTVTDEDSITPEGDTSTETAPDEEIGDSESVTVTFYDADGTTVFLSLTMIKGTYLSSYVDDIAKIIPVKRGYQLKRWYRIDNDKSHTPKYIYDDLKFNKSVQFKAEWDTTPYSFDIAYETNGGEIIAGEDGTYPTSFTVASEAVTLPAAKRQGYFFDGWYTDAALTTAVTAIPQGTYIDSDQSGVVAPYTVYAKWTEVKPAQMQQPTAKNTATGKIKVKYTKLADVDGYELTYSSDSNVQNNTMTRTFSKNKSSYTLTNLPKGKTYYFKVRAYKLDSVGEKCYGEYSSICSCKVTKGVKEYTAKSNSGKLKKVSVKNNTDLYVKAAVTKRLKSSDDYYYLVKVDPNTGKVLKQISKTDKTTSVVFQLPLRDEDGNNHIMGKFGIAIKNGKKYMLITSTSYINNPEDAATYTGAFPTPASKKGRQGLYDSSLGDKNYFFNYSLNYIIGSESSHNVAYKYNGNTYYFNKPYLSGVASVNQDGGTVTMQLMLEWTEDCQDLILKSGRTPGAHYYAFNTDDRAAREKIEAALCFLGEELSKEGYHIDNWILGNEVNTYANPGAKWHYAGNISKEKFMKNYANTYRMLYYAVKSNSKNSRVYICCDHTWTDVGQDWGTRYFTEAFNKEIKSQNKNIQWNLAYHAYSAMLTNADFWNDGKLAPNKVDAQYVSPKNLEILTDYVKKNFGEDVRIILSEQGFSYSGGVGSPHNAGRQTGEDVQAAAMAWLYYKVQFNNMIDAVIFCSGDHGGAGLQFDIYGKKAENVYKYMDTPQYAAYTKDCLTTIGKSSWKKAVKGFKSSILKKMPNR